MAVANQLAGEGVVFVAGHFCSGSSIPASQVYNEEGILQISPASTNPKLTDEAKGNNVFRICGRDDQQGRVAGDYIADNYKGKKVAVIHDKSAYGKGLADETQKAHERRRPQGKDVRGVNAGRPGLLGPGQQDEAGRHRRDLLSAATTPKPA